MQITSNRLEAVPFHAATSCGGHLASPSLIIVHDTAGRLDRGNSVSWFLSPECNVSAHVVVERDGSITQLVPFDKVAYHAGKSTWEGRQGCNGYAIGIEIVNPGALSASGKAWFHTAHESGFPMGDLKHAITKEHGDAYWMPYTDAQIEAVTKLCQGLVATYPCLKEIVGHFHVSPGRKVDVNPLFPIDELRHAVFAAPAPAPAHAEAPVETPAPAPIVIPPRAPEVVRPAPVIRTAYNSRSLWAQLSAALAIAYGAITNGIQQVGDWIIQAVGIVPAVYNESKGAMTNAQEMAQWFHVNWASISIVFAVTCVSVAFVRHLRDKRSLTDVQNSKPTGPPG